MKNHLIDISTLRKLLRYEPVTGKLYWIYRQRRYFKSHQEMNRWNGRYSGQEALIADNGAGYLQGKILNRPYKAHRVVWAVFFHRWPVVEIDHIDGNRANNIIQNLRDVDRLVNSKNAAQRHDNTSGVTGVSWCKLSGSWRAYINFNGVRHELGKFDDKNEAVCARSLAAQDYGYSDRHGRPV